VTPHNVQNEGFASYWGHTDHGGKHFMRFTLGKSHLVATAAMVSISVLTAAGSVLTLPTPVYAQEQIKTSDSNFDGIVVSGKGEVLVKPNIARITLGIQNQGKEASGVAQENAQKTDALIKAIKVTGVADKDIRTSGYNLYPQYDYKAQEQGKAPEIVGYQASNTVTVTVRKIADSGKVIDTAIKAGGNAASGILFDLEDDAAAQDEALQKAVADATRKAKAIAKAIGTQGLFLVGVQESNYSAPRPMFREAMVARSADVAPTPIQPGEQTVTANVSVRFQFVDHNGGPNSTGPGIRIPLNK
jgi:uncharacterized protein YggE